MLRSFAACVLALGLIGGCTTPPAPMSAPPAKTPTTPPPQQAALHPTPAPSPVVVCHIVEADCAKAIQLARARAPANVASADTIVVADICPPEVVCDRFWAFDSIVVFVRSGTLIAAYEVTGVRGPEVASRVVAPLPAHIETLVRGASPTP